MQGKTSGPRSTLTVAEVDAALAMAHGARITWGVDWLDADGTAHGSIRYHEDAGDMVATTFTLGVGLVHTTGGTVKKTT